MGGCSGDCGTTRCEFCDVLICQYRDCYGGRSGHKWLNDKHACWKCLVRWDSFMEVVAEHVADAETRNGLVESLLKAAH